MSSQALILALAEELNQDLQLNENNRLVINIDEIPLLIQWHPEVNIFHLQMDLGEVTAMGGREILVELLSANFLATETAGAFISYDSSMHHAFLEYQINSLELDGMSFISQIESFVNLVDVWRGRLEESNKRIEKEVQKSIGDVVKSWEEEIHDSELEGQNFIRA